ncbi:MAG TPA: bifunctional 4-hydroxy-2-oxoglutarate aldolase/2-dehydro-3-deoxy-phosphogluconate aldolase [Actinomycetota bacterium]
MFPGDGPPILSVIRYREPSDLDAAVAALREGGISLIEVTAETPGSLEAVRRAAAVGVPLGAGTIRTVEQADAFAQAGASFLVGPGFHPEVVSTAVRRGIPAIPGALTPTEVATALKAGATAVKLFPATLGGPPYLRALRGPFPDVRFVPTGGIGLEDIPAWLDAGARCVGLGSALTGTAAPEPSELAALTRRARRAVDLAAR